MSPPPNVPGVPGMKLPAPWAQEMAELRERIEILEARSKLQSISDAEEDSQVKIPSDAPKAAKSALGALQGVPPEARAVVLIVAILAAAVVVVVLALHGMKVF